MSKSLYWSIIPPDPKQNSLYSLKHTLAKKLWASDGSCGEDYITVGKELIPFLEGIEMGNGSGDMGRDARKLINAIEKYGKIRLVIA